MKCKLEGCEVDVEPKRNRNGKEKLYCCDAHQIKAYQAEHFIKRKTPKSASLKRKRGPENERERLKTALLQDCHSTLMRKFLEAHGDSGSCMVEALLWSNTPNWMPETAEERTR
jgi:hypothetical protein